MAVGSALTWCTTSDAGTAPAPVVIVLHGGGGNAENAVRNDRRRLHRHSATGSSPSIPMARRVCRALASFFVERRALLRRGHGGRRRRRRVHRRHHRRPGVEGTGASVARVYVTGMSNGAMMAHRLGRELSTKLAAIAPVVGAVFGDEPAPRAPVPAFIIVGAEDENVPPGGGPLRVRALLGRPRPTATSRRRSRRRRIGRATMAAASRRDRTKGRQPDGVAALQQRRAGRLSERRRQRARLAGRRARPRRRRTAHAELRCVRRDVGVLQDAGPQALGCRMLPLFAAAALTLAMADGPAAFDAEAAERFASLALDCVHKEYPNKIAHVLAATRTCSRRATLTPAFFGCYDWHSSVHGHWLLARLARTLPDGAVRGPRARGAGAEPDAGAHRRRGRATSRARGATTFERPYGLAWLLQLAAELRDWDDPQARGWSRGAEPLEARGRGAALQSWLPKLTRPDPRRRARPDRVRLRPGARLGARRRRRGRWTTLLALAHRELLRRRTRACPLELRAVGPGLPLPLPRRGRPDAPGAAAGPLRRVARRVPAAAPAGRRPPRWLAPAVVTDPSDPKLAHLDGLNLSRAWMLRAWPRGLPAADPRLAGAAGGRGAPTARPACAPSPARTTRAATGWAPSRCTS